MKIRNRITLWITAAGLLAGLLFSIAISFELIEQPYELLDGELDSQAHTLLAGFSSHKGHLVPQADRTMLASLGKLYWLKIFNKQHQIVFASSLTQFANLPLKKEYGGYNISATIPRQAVSLEQDDRNEVTFRVRVFSIPLGEEEYLVQIARPMEKLQEEIYDLVISIAIGLLLYTIALVLFGYFAAGRILKPIADINVLAREISEKTLDKRIPQGKNKDELYTLSSSLNQMFDRLQYSFRLQKEFIANASHELKTPIAMLRLFFGEALQRNDLPDDLTGRLASQSANVLRMDRLVKNLLELSTLELKETFAPAQVDLTRTLTTILHEFKEIIQAAGIQLDVTLEDVVSLYGDGEKLRRMFINLIDNAIKYNRDENGQIRVSLKKEDKVAEIRMYNTGATIPKAEQNRIFDQFYRLEKSRASTSGGSGLGLTIVKRIVELHQGQIAVEHGHDSGTEIHIMLPLQSSY